MYPPPHHQINDRNKMIEVIKHYPLSMLVTVQNGKPLISHIPLFFNEVNDRLIGHIDLQNPQVGSLQEGNEVKLIFKGPDTYISPSIYTTDQLPTWNYIIVHLTGIISVIDNPSTIKKTMVDMTRFLEAPDYKYSLNLNDPKMNRLVQYIHAFNIEITHWEGKFKLSQDKCEQDQINANEQLMRINREEIDSIFKKLFK
jgi:transcriptional regulator